MTDRLFDAVVSIDDLIEDLEQNDSPTKDQIKSARKALEVIKGTVAPALFSWDEARVCQEMFYTYVQESCPSDLGHLKLEEREKAAQKLYFKIVSFVVPDVNETPALSHVSNALDLLRTIHYGNETKRSQDILSATMRSLRRAIGEI